MNCHYVSSCSLKYLTMPFCHSWWIDEYARLAVTVLNFSIIFKILEYKS